MSNIDDKQVLVDSQDVDVAQKSAQMQRLGLHALQKQLQNIRLREYLTMGGMSVGAALLRVPMQVVPSAEPISFFAFLAGWMLGPAQGFAVGASALYISNFLVIGGQGPWTPFQLVAFGIIGALGGLLYRRGKKATLLEILPLALLGTVVFEFIMNIQSSMWLGFNVFYAFVTSLPFSIVHIVSNLLFFLFLPFAYRFAVKKGGFDEKQLCLDLTRRLRGIAPAGRDGRSGKYTIEK